MDANLMTMIVTAVLVLAALVISFLSAKTYGWLHVSLAFLIFVFAGVFIVFAAGVMKYQQKYRSQLAGWDKDIARLQSQSRALEHGTSDPTVVAELELSLGGVRDIRSKLNQLTLSRGRVWRGAAPQSVDAASPTLQVQLAEGASVTIENGMTLQAFEEGPIEEGASYLGEFIVTGVTQANRTISLQPALPLTDRERQRMAASRKSWVLYEIMPIDRHDILAGLSDDQLRSMFPADVVGEYIKDGKPAEPGDSPDRVRDMAAEGQPSQPVYVRPLRDYQLAFHNLLSERSELLASIRQTEAGKAQMQETLDLAKQDVARREREKQRLASDLARLEWERGVVEGLRSAANAQYSRLVQRLTSVMEQNRRLVAQLTEAQLSRGDPVNAAP